MPYVNPPRLPTSFFGHSWTHQQQNYFWHPGAQQTNYPHLHLTGGTVSGIVTITNRSYTTGGAGGNINLAFDANNGFPLIDAHPPIPYQMAYNIMIAAINAALPQA